jgi:erythronate-4-phosphate dehydrogenase
MMKVIIDDKIPFIKGLLEPVANVIYIKGSNICKEDIIDADALIIRTRTKCDEKLLKDTKVKFIATATIGSDHIDNVWCNANGIKWTNAPGCNSGSVMQYITAAILFLAKKHKLKLSDLTLGVVGVGNVGKKIVKIAGALGIRVLQNDPIREIAEGKGRFCNLNDLLAQSDIVTVHVPLTFTDEYPTYHLANDHFFSVMKQNSFFINSSRGQVCDEISLKKALKNEYITGCVLDVWETEPTPDNYLLKITDITTPHIAGYSLDGKLNATLMAVKAMSDFFNIKVTLPTVDKLQQPENPVIDISKYDKNEQKALTDIILKTYPISIDSDLLKKSPENFEAMRGDYWPRREFEAFSIKGEHKIKNTLLNLGFRG